MPLLSLSSLSSLPLPFLFPSPPPGDKEGRRVMTVLATLGSIPDRQHEITYGGLKLIGNGSFGVVYQAVLIDTNESVAIKKVLQDKRFKVCREACLGGVALDDNWRGLACQHQY